MEYFKKGLFATLGVYTGMTLFIALDKALGKALGIDEKNEKDEKKSE